MTRRRLAAARRQLTSTELDMLRLASHGYGNAQIAGEHGTTEQVVKNRFYLLFARLGVGDRAGAVAKALREGLIK